MRSLINAIVLEVGGTLPIPSPLTIMSIYVHPLKILRGLAPYEAMPTKRRLDLMLAIATCARSIEVRETHGPYRLVLNWIRAVELIRKSNEGHIIARDEGSIAMLHAQAKLFYHLTKTLGMPS